MSEDIEILAGEVEVSGIVSYPDNSCISNEDWNLVLVPSHGISRERITATKVSNPSGWTGEWSASVQPGDWVVYASLDTQNQNCQGLVSIKSMEVGVEGGSLDSELTIGGILNLNTRWLDFDGGVHDLSEIPDYDLKFEIGAISWSETLDEDGTISILTIPSTIQVSSEFEISEGNRNVSYSGGQGIAIRAGQDSPLKTLNVERESNQTSPRLPSVNRGKL